MMNWKNRGGDTGGDLKTRREKKRGKRMGRCGMGREVEMRVSRISVSGCTLEKTPPVRDGRATLTPSMVIEFNFSLGVGCTNVTQKLRSTRTFKRNFWNCCTTCFFFFFRRTLGVTF